MKNIESIRNPLTKGYIIRTLIIITGILWIFVSSFYIYYNSEDLTNIKKFIIVAPGFIIFVSGLIKPKRKDIDYTLYIAPIVLTTNGLFTWAVRGGSGFGGAMGCLFAGLLFGLTWYLFSREKNSIKTRRYNNGWTIFALLVGIGLSGMQGWGDIASLIRSELIYEITPEGLRLSQYVDPRWGFSYMVLLGFHWAGTGGLLLAWSGSKTPVNLKIWIYRILSVALGAVILLGIAQLIPTAFYPNYNKLNQYDIEMFPKLPDLISEINACLLFTGGVLGGLFYEILLKDYINVLVILIPSIITGILWSVNFYWAAEILEKEGLNTWRVWESLGGGAIGIGFGIVYFLFNRKIPPYTQEVTNIEDPESLHILQREQPYSKFPSLEKMFGIYFSIIIGLALAIYNGIGGWRNIEYMGDDDLNDVPTNQIIIIGVVGILMILLVFIFTLKRPNKALDNRVLAPAYGFIFIICYIFLRIIGLKVTWKNPPAEEGTIDDERIYYDYYLVLMYLELFLIGLWLYLSGYLKKRVKKISR